MTETMEIKLAPIKKGPKCDDTIEALLKKVIQQNSACNPIVKCENNPTEVILYIDDDKCRDKDA